MLSSSSASSSRTDYTASAPAVSLPKGGGAIQGIGEKFSVNPVTGTGSLSVPIAVSPGRGFAPELAVSYDSGAGNGPFGMGWAMGVPSIRRKTQKGLPRYLDIEDSDEFLLSGAEDLVPLLEEEPENSGTWDRYKRSGVLPSSRLDTTVLATDEQKDAFLSSFPFSDEPYTVQRYRPRMEGLFARIERWQHEATGDIHWRVTTPDNVTSVYGKDENSRIVDPAKDSRVFEWLLCESYDDKGNVIIYRYKAEDSAKVDRSDPQEKNRYQNDDSPTYTNRYLKRILYGNRSPYQRSRKPETWNSGWLFQVVFDYGEHGQWNDKNEEIKPPTPDDVNPWKERQDSFSSYRSGFEIRTQRLCRRVLMFHRFDAKGGINNPRLDSSGNESKSWYLVRSTNFQYAENPVATYLTGVIQTGHRWNIENKAYESKSYPPVEFEYDQPAIHHEIKTVDPASLVNLPVGLDNGAYQFLDLDGEGISGILTQQGGGWFYKANRGNGEFAPLQPVAKQPVSAGQQRFLDLAGDGQLDLVLLNRESPGFYERSLDEDWQNFQAFRQLPNVDWNDPNLRLVDLNGDGHADILLSEEQVFVWHPSMAEDGFGPSTRVEKSWDEETGPALVFADASQSVYLSDMSGDGLNDIVRIRNGAVCYWPNLGYGRFGAKVTKDAPPYFDHPELFEQRRIRLADIDGSGTTDIVYLGQDGVTLWFNQAGNSWSDGKTLEQFPQVDNLASVQVVELLGQGTACLVWASPFLGAISQRMLYVDLMGGRKPHLLTGTKNNLGAETRLHYAPSTQFYLADKQAGNPWITKIPFPVHVLEKTETFDHISGNRFASSYAYHHGYFDGVEREFRGFGYVEQWDTDEYETFKAEGKKTFKVKATNDQGEESHMPPVYTRTWFHTGVYIDRKKISNFFETEYYLGDAEARLLDDTVLPEGLTLQEEREACRALRGQMLRQEVYAQDGTDQAKHPYTVTEANYTIRVVQPMRDERHGVFFTHARESLAYHYERNPADPRIAHQIALEVDEFGTVLKALAVAYPRRQPKYPQQRKIMATLSETIVIHEPGKDSWYRLGLPWESRTYEVTGLTPELLETLIDGTETLSNQLAQATTLNYEDKPNNGLEKRLIEQMRMRYRSNATAGELNPAALDWGKIESLALPYESYELAFTPGLLQQVYGGQGRDASAGPLPGLLQAADLDSLLTKEGRYVKADGLWWMPSGRQALDAKHFYLPIQSRDPFGQIAKTTYDQYQLAVIHSQDPIGNEVRAEHDYWALQPKLITDPNGNRQAVAFDTLGMVVGTAVMGKENTPKPEGDSLQEFKANLTQTEIDNFLAVPGATAVEHLGKATTRIIYDLDRFWRSQKDYPDDSSQWQPVYAATLAREVHGSDLRGQSLLRPNQVQVSFEYSDGFGREVQTKVQAEPGQARRWDPQAKKVVQEEANPRWVGTGRTIYNNKGKPIKQYEPFFSITHGYEDESALVEYGVTPILFYDPLGRVVATLHPNHTYEKVVFDSWQQTSWDVNDTLTPETRDDPTRDPDVGHYFQKLEKSEYLPTWYSRNSAGTTTEKDAAKKAIAHAETPSVAHLDTLGRPFLTIANNGQKNGVDQLYETWMELDIEGNPLVITDARDNRVMEYAYEIRAGEDDEDEGEEEAYRLYLKSMDAGERWTLYNVAGNPIREWDSRGFEVRQAYDVLQRPTHLMVKDAEGKEILAERLVYGEGHREVDRLNLRGQMYQQYDGAGVITSEEFDFKGNLRQGSRRLTKEYKRRMDWSAIGVPTDLSQQEGKLTADEITRIETAAETLLEKGKPFTTSSQFDALNRPTAIVMSDKSVTRPVYNEANLLNQMWVQVRGKGDFEKFVDNIDYDAKGQREKIVYGNGVTTTYKYEKETYRLIRLVTTRAKNPKTLQDFAYTYDPAGNITTIHDAAQPELFNRGEKIEPFNRYTYDALYRLISAQGREHRGKDSNNKSEHLPGAKPHYDFNDSTRRNGIHPNDLKEMRNYSRRYEYDEVGNIEAMIHQAVGNGWRRDYKYATDSNRLLRTTLPGSSLPGGATARWGEYVYDDHGNMEKMPHLEVMEWDFEDQLQATQRQRTINETVTPEKTYYVYDAGGQRVRKVTERFSANGTPTRLRERIYLGGVEIYREYDGNGIRKTLERETLHVMDDEQRIALVETKTIEEKNGVGQEISNPISVFRYQLGNHLGSACWELDRDGAEISYEEYYPYGSTSYQAGRSGAEVGLKQYRYTGKEKDEESGFYYHGARYYACWLGRWTSADASGIEDGINLYIYVANNPVIFIDPSGHAKQKSDSRLAKRRKEWAVLQKEISAFKRAARREQNLRSTFSRKKATSPISKIQLMEMQARLATRLENNIGGFISGMSWLSIHFLGRNLHGDRVDIPKYATEAYNKWIEEGVERVGFGFYDLLLMHPGLGAPSRVNSLRRIKTATYVRSPSLALRRRILAHGNKKNLRSIALLTDADPARAIFGAASKSHPTQHKKIIDSLRKSGVEVIEREGVMAYGPSPSPGKPGQIVIDPNASYSALKHEYQHFLDDRALNFPGMSKMLEPNLRWRLEQSAYNIEIGIMKKARRPDVVKQLKRNLKRERIAIFGK